MYLVDTILTGFVSGIYGSFDLMFHMQTNHTNKVGYARLCLFNTAEEEHMLQLE